MFIRGCNALLAGLPDGAVDRLALFTGILPYDESLAVSLPH